MAKTKVRDRVKGMRAERWILLGAVVVCSVWLMVMSLYLIGEGHRNCTNINRSNAGNRAAWQFMEQTVRARWTDTSPAVTEKNTINAFFAGIQERLKPISC